MSDASIWISQVETLNHFDVTVHTENCRQMCMDLDLDVVRVIRHLSHLFQIDVSLR